MRKNMIFCLLVIAVLAIYGCGSREQPAGESGDTEKAVYTEALDVLHAVTAAYDEGELFAVYGGNQDDPVMDAPGRFDVSKTQEMELALGLPESQSGSVDDAASMVHLMNSNTFTGAVYHLRDGVNVDDFADAVKSGILDRQWICGQPDTLLIIDAGGGYVLTAYGEAQIMETFRDNALSALTGAEILSETPIA